jgi:hypothetical protein
MMWGGLPDLRGFRGRPAGENLPIATGEGLAVAPDIAFDLALSDILALRRLWSARHGEQRLPDDGPSRVTLKDLGLAA